LLRRRRAPAKSPEEFTVVTPNTKTANDTAPEMPAFAEKFHEQLISTLKQGQKLSLDAAQAWMKAVSVLPLPDLPKIPGLPDMPGVEAATKYTFDVAAELLEAQRDFALQLESALTPATTS
jgi:hypothetical protein